MNKAEGETEHAIGNTFSSTAIALLKEERDDCVYQLRQCEWMFKSGNFRPADYKTTSKNCKRGRSEETK
jgi:hypothetical protein